MKNKKLRDREKRYLKKYGIGLDTYNLILTAQHFMCGACGRPASSFTTPLQIDHEHFKVTAVRTIYVTGYPPPELKWKARTTVQGQYMEWYDKTKERAISVLKEHAMPYSIRGLLCPGRHGPAGTCCNRNMGRIDKPEWLKKVVYYLENPPARKVLDFLG